VCAGVADYLEVEPWSVRLVFLVSILFGGWFLIPIYFIAWFCLDDKPGAGISDIADSQPFRHFRTVDYGKKLYRNTEQGKFLGVCAGVADYLEVNVFAVRLGFLLLVFFTAALPLFLYFGAYFILEEKPYTRPRRARHETRRHRRKKMEDGFDSAQEGTDTKDDVKVYGAAFAFGDTNKTNRKARSQEVPEEQENFDTNKYSKRREFKYCARKFAILQDRLAKMEAYVTSSQFRLHREFKNI
jgi:phage shock protein PspC (stress-responsive transcriptional regulator)